MDDYRYPNDTDLLDWLQKGVGGQGGWLAIDSYPVLYIKPNQDLRTAIRDQMAADEQAEAEGVDW